MNPAPAIATTSTSALSARATRHWVRVIVTVLGAVAAAAAGVSAGASTGASAAATTGASTGVSTGATLSFAGTVGSVGTAGLSSSQSIGISFVALVKSNFSIRVEREQVLVDT